MSDAARADLAPAPDLEDDAVLEVEAAEAEEAGVVRTVTYEGLELELPDHLGIAFSVQSADAYQATKDAQKAKAAGDAAAEQDADNRANLAAITQMRLLFGAKFEALIELDPSIEQIKGLLRDAVAQYGTTPGEASASAKRSKSTGPKSRRTSSGTTG